MTREGRPFSFQINFILSTRLWRWTLNWVGEEGSPFIVEMDSANFNLCVAYVNGVATNKASGATPYLNITRLPDGFLEMKINRITKQIMEGNHRNGECLFESEGSFAVDMPESQLRALSGYLNQLKGN